MTWSYHHIFGFSLSLLARDFQFMIFLPLFICTYHLSLYNYFHCKEGKYTFIGYFHFPFQLFINPILFSSQLLPIPFHPFFFWHYRPRWFLACTSIWANWILFSTNQTTALLMSSSILSLHLILGNLSLSCQTSFLCARHWVVLVWFKQFLILLWSHLPHPSMFGPVILLRVCPSNLSSCLQVFFLTVCLTVIWNYRSNEHFV